MELSPRLMVPGYRIVAVLDADHGVFVVQQLTTGKVFVQKILDVYNEDIYRFLQTKHIAGTPAVLECMQAGEQLVVIEEYISGTTLQERMESGPLTLPEVLSYADDLCAVLAALHGCRPAIIHRDIKPSNVMLTHYDRAILLDFNAAKHYSPTAAEDTVLLGTQGYAAPEQYGFGASSPQTDIYAMGVLLKELLAVVACPPKDRTRLHAIADKCTQLNPEDRYQTAGALREALLQLADPSHTVTTPRTSASLVPPGFRTRTPWKMLLALAAYALIIGFSLTLDILNTHGWLVWANRITLLSICLYVIAVCFNYLNLQRILPLCRHELQPIRYLGIGILVAAGSLFLMAILLILEAVFG